ncbi:MAG: amidohydrolase family protein, partial [Planctomycetota bacterium JB042]
SLYWMVSGKTVGGTQLVPTSKRLTRLEALRLFTVGSAWLSGEHEQKGTLRPGQFADLAVLSADYFRVPHEAIKRIESDLTIVAGEVVHATGRYAALAPAPRPVDPPWSPVARFGGDRSAKSSDEASVENGVAR